ncbi:MAG: ABC transporter permease [Betaproteobacteria bacterium]|nr:ABC transporter permease [Betaproteobacteria bacterium]
MSFALSIAAAALLEALRNRLLWLAGIVIGVALGLAQFLNQVAITESLQIQLALLAAMLRLAAVFIVSTFIITSMVREANDKVTELLLSQPAPRSAYFFGKFAGYGLVGVVLAFLFSLPLALFAPPGALLYWSASLACELLIMTAVSLFCVLSLTQVLSAFAATAGFYLLARSMAAMQLIASSPLVKDNTFVDDVVAQIVNAIALVLPALDRMTQTAWLTDAAPRAADFGLVLAQTAIYVLLIAAASLFDLYRKNF